MLCILYLLTCFPLLFSLFPSMSNTKICDNTPIGRQMAKMLRHNPNKKGVAPDGSGYTNLELLRADLPKRMQLSDLSFAEFLEIIKQIVTADNKHRFSLRTDANGVYYIRANQGHSEAWQKYLKPEMIYRPITRGNYRELCNSSVIIHGTNPNAYGEIMEDGCLRRMGRLGIHFAPRNGAKSGRRTNASVLLCFSIEQLLKCGLRLYLSDNDVILCPDDIPIEMATCLLSDDQGKTWHNEATGETFPECDINAKLGIEPTAATVEPEAEACAVAATGEMFGYLPKTNVPVIAPTEEPEAEVLVVAASGAMLGYLPKAAATVEPVVELMKPQYLSAADAAILLGQPLVEPAIATAEPSETEPLDAAAVVPAVMPAIVPAVVPAADEADDSPTTVCGEIYLLLSLMLYLVLAAIGSFI